MTESLTVWDVIKDAYPILQSAETYYHNLEKYLSENPEILAGAAVALGLVLTANS